MGKVVHSVSLSIEISSKLEKQGNKSALIEALLIKHFGINPEELQKDIAEKVEILEKVKETEQEKESELAAIKEKQNKKEEDKKEQLKQMFREDLGRDITEEELNTFLELIGNGLTSYFKFLDELKNGVK